MEVEIDENGIVEFVEYDPDEHEILCELGMYNAVKSVKGCEHLFRPWLCG